MTTIELARERRLIDLLEHAIDHPEAQRRQVLEALCDDESLVEEVLLLLQDEDDDFLARPAVEELIGRPVVEGAGDVRALLRRGVDSAFVLAN